MSLTLDNLKAQLLANKAKSAILGVLLVVGVFVVIKNFATPNPRTASALAINRMANTGTDDTVSDMPVLSPKELQDRATESKALWQVLEEKHGLTPANGFGFDPAYYTLDPSYHPPVPQEVVAPHVVDAQSGTTAVKNNVPDERMKTLAIRELAKTLVLQSTVLGSTPMAIINTGVYRVGDQVGDFQIKAIRARQIVVEKDGITLAVDMAK